MDAVVPLAGQIVQVLTPFLPYLLKGGEDIGAAVAKTGEGQAIDLASKLWSRLNPKVQSRPAASEAAADLASEPGDEDAQAALRVQLRKLLLEDPSLARELSGLLQAAGPVSTVTNVSVRGDRSVGIGGDVRGSTIDTGDEHKP